MSRVAHINTNIRLTISLQNLTLALLFLPRETWSTKLVVLTNINAIADKLNLATYSHSPQIISHRILQTINYISYENYLTFSTYTTTYNLDTFTTTITIILDKHAPLTHSQLKATLIQHCSIQIYIFLKKGHANLAYFLENFQQHTTIIHFSLYVKKYRQYMKITKANYNKSYWC